MTADQKKKKQYTAADNPIEQLKDTVAGAVNEVGQIPVGLVDEALSQIGLKPQRAPMSGEFDLVKKTEKTNTAIDQKDRSIDAKIRQLQYVQRNEKEVFNQKQRQTENQIRQLLHELAVEVKKLEAQTSELTKDVRKVTVESLPTNPGAYHLNFIDAVMLMLRDLRKSVSESRQWLALSMKKKNQKGYWAMFKKHGTSFAMSEERAIASANG